MQERLLDVLSRRSWGLVLVALTALSSPLQAAPADSEARITAIDVVGNHAIDRQTILSQVHSQVGQPVLARSVQQDVESIEDMGDFSSVTVRQETVPGGIHLVYRVEENPLLQGVELAGNRLVPTPRLVALMAVQTGKPLNTRILNGDIRVIDRYYDNELGYLVEPTHVTHVHLDAKGVLHVEVREAVPVHKVVIQGATVFPPADLLKHVTERAGNLFNQNDARDDASRLARQYDRADFALDAIQPTFEQATGTLTYQIVEARVDQVRVEGNTRTREDFILQTLRTKAGDVLRRKVVAADAERLKKLGLFEVVHLEAEPADKPGHVILVAHVKEAKTGDAHLGASYGASTGTTPGGLVGGLSVSEKNLGGSGQALSATWQRGSTLDSTALSYYVPRIDSRSDSLTMAVSDQSATGLQQAVPGVTPGTSTSVALYNQKVVGESLSLGHELSDSVHDYVTAVVQDVHITENASSAFTPVGLGSGQVHGLGWGSILDTRDDMADPHQGAYGDVSLFGSGGPLGGDFSYSKVQGEIRKYVAFGGQTLAFRLWGGSIAGSAPATDFFYIGGTNSLRGYSDNALFGNAFVVASSEYRFPLSKKLSQLSGAVFVEAGNASDVRSDVFGHMLTDTGIGLRLSLPSLGLGVLRLDYAVGQNGGRTSIGIGPSW